MTGEPSVLFEDNHLLVVCKPAGMPSQPDHSGDPSLVDWGMAYLKQRHGKPGAVYLGLPHRLDRPVSGVMALARTSKAAARLARAFADRTAHKRYLAVLERPPEPPAAALDDWLLPGDRERPTRVVRRGTPGAQAAQLRYAALAPCSLGAVVEIELGTGRKHQIRAQLAARGWPILGDTRYGARRPYRAGAIALHAHKLTLPHPIGGAPVTFVAPSPWSAT